MSIDKTSDAKTPSIVVFFEDAIWENIVFSDGFDNFVTRVLEKESFRVSHTDMTYRQINYLDSSGLLGSGREDNENKWRVFATRDIIYLHIINELKKFGVTIKHLRAVHDFFYGSKTKREISNEVLGACFMGAEMTLIIHSDAKGHVFSPMFLHSYDNLGLLRSDGGMAEIRIRINDAVNRTAKDRNLPEVKIKDSVGSRITELVTKLPSDVELKILEVIRNKQYEQIKLKKKNGKPSVLYAESSSKSDISEQELLAEISKNNFSDVQIKKRDGRVVHYKQEKTIKL